MTSGIYLWTVDRSSEGKIPLVYVGQSRNLERRKIQHLEKWNKRDSTRTNSRLMNAANFYGSENVSWTVIEECDLKSLTDREVYWYYYYLNSPDVELANFMCPTENPMDTPEIRKRTGKGRAKGAERKRGFVYQFWKDGILYKAENGLAEFLREQGIPIDRESAFRRLYKGTVYTAYGFTSGNPNINRERKQGGCVKGREKNQVVKLVSPEGKIYETTNGVLAFSREHGLGKTGLNNVTRGVQKQHKGWKLYNPIEE